MSRITTCCADGQHTLCSTRLNVNPSDGWHYARYVPCECDCHSVVAGIERARQAQQEHEQKHDVQLEIDNIGGYPIPHGPGPDCLPED